MLRFIGPRWDALLWAALIAALVIVLGLSAGETPFAVMGVVMLFLVGLSAVMKIVVWGDKPSMPVVYILGIGLLFFASLVLVDMVVA